MKIQNIKIFLLVVYIVTSTACKQDVEKTTDENLQTQTLVNESDKSKSAVTGEVNNSAETTSSVKNVEANIRLASIDKKNNDFKIEKPVEQEFTSLIVDCRGLGVKPAMSPSILDEKGNNIYPGNIPVKFEDIVNDGIVSYTRSDLEMAKKNQRSGSKPLIVKGKAPEGIHNDSVIVPYEMINKIKEANKNNKFLESYKVIFLID